MISEETSPTSEPLQNWLAVVDMTTSSRSMTALGTCMVTKC